jgi:hypothetical protein
VSTVSHRAPIEEVAPDAPSSMMQITLPAEVLRSARRSVADGLSRGLRRELDAQHTENLQAQLQTSTDLDDAVAQATGDAAQQGIMAAQAASGPETPPSLVSDAAEQTFRAALPRQLTMSVQPVVLDVLGDLSSEVSAAALSSALGTAANQAAAQVSDQVAVQVGTQVASLVQTTEGSGVAAPTATVSADPMPEVPVTTAPDSSDAPTTVDTSTDRPDGEPGRSSTSEPTSSTSDPATDPGTDRGTQPTETTEPTDPGTDRGTEPTETTEPTDPGTDRGTEPTDPTPSSSKTATDTAAESNTSRGAGPTDDPTSPTSVPTSATSTVTVTVTASTDGADRTIRIAR